MLLTKHSNSCSGGNQLDFRACFYLIRERFWLVAICLLVAALGVAAYLARAPRVYASKAVLQVEQQEQKILNIEQVQREDWQSQESLKTVEQTLQNRAMSERVLLALDLENNRRFNPPSAEGPASLDVLIHRLGNMVAVRLRKGTRLIDLAVEHTDPALARQIADALIREFLRFNSEHSSSASRDATQMLQVEAEQLKAKLEASESALQAYREQTQSASLEEKQNVVVQRLKELSAKVTEAKSRRIAQEVAWEQVRQMGNDLEALQVLPAVSEHPAVQEIRSEIAKQESAFANLTLRYRPKHPKYIQGQKQLEGWKRALKDAILEMSQTIQASYESASAAEAALEAALQRQEAAALELNRQSVRYNALLRDVESDRALYQAVLNRIKETSVTQDIQPAKARVIQPATLPVIPIKPQKIRIVVLGLAAGLAAGLGLVFLLAALDQSVKTVDQAEDQLGLPVLSTIPKLHRSSEAQGPLILGDLASSVEGESFRTLRTALSLLGRKEDRRTFLFTSALPSEGKTFCALNFALSLAQQGLRTLIIDCDLRRPTVEKHILNKNQRGVGVTDFIAGQKFFAEVTHATAHENLSCVPAGTSSPNPAELLAQNGIDSLIDEALLQFDRVVVDSPPIHAVSDTLLILNRIQTLCMVIRVRKTPTRAVRRAIQLLAEAGAPLAGLILNLLPRSRAGYGCYYNSYYDYSYHGYYHETKAAAQAEAVRPCGTAIKAAT